VLHSVQGRHQDDTVGGWQESPLPEVWPEAANPVPAENEDLVIGIQKENTISIEKENADRNICPLEGRRPA